MDELALFAGAGGGLLGTALLGWRPVCAVEIEPFCREILLRRQRDGLLPLFPIWDDVRTFDGRPWRGLVDVVSGGFPCQPFSAAGKRLGEADERNLWPETIRVIREVGPGLVFLENVPALLAHKYFGTILGELSESGYRVVWKVISVAELGAPHRRDRLWIVGHADDGGLARDDGRWARAESSDGRSEMANAERHRRKQGTENLCEGEPEPANGREDVADADRERFRISQTHEARREQRGRGAPSGCSWWDFEPAMGRVAHGVAHRVDRLRALGNGQVPAVVRAAWEFLSSIPIE
ncbi:MAG: DNA cytosine methyltransferase [Proteobacteria bacterium]|nr:DNA cytosine methyltransferase [Pseudomonadota bacterium]